MSIPPPPFDLPFDGSAPPASTAPGTRTNFSSRNTYSNLSDDEDSEDELIRATNNIRLEATSEEEPAVSIQSRYLRIRVILLIADCLRNQAIQAQKVRADSAEDRVKKYEDIRQHWTEGWKLLEATTVELDSWIVIELTEDLDNIPDHHDIDQLRNLLENLSITKEDTEREKAKAIEFLARRLDTLQKKLNPMLRERDEVKRNFGEQSWKNNPDPKFDYAEKRREWEEEVKLIELTIETLVELKLVTRQEPMISV